MWEVAEERKTEGRNERHFSFVGKKTITVIFPGFALLSFGLALIV